MLSVDAGYLVSDQSNYVISLYDRKDSKPETMMIGKGKKGVEIALAHMIAYVYPYGDTAEETQVLVEEYREYVDSATERLSERLASGEDMTTHGAVELAWSLQERKNDLRRLEEDLARASVWKYVAIAVENGTLNVDEPANKDMKDLLAQFKKPVITLGDALWVMAFQDSWLLESRMNGFEVKVVAVKTV